MDTTGWTSYNVYNASSQCLPSLSLSFLAFSVPVLSLLRQLNQSLRVSPALSLSDVANHVASFVLFFQPLRFLPGLASFWFLTSIIHSLIHSFTFQIDAQLQQALSCIKPHYLQALDAFVLLRYGRWHSSLGAWFDSLPASSPIIHHTPALAGLA